MEKGLSLCDIRGCRFRNKKCQCPTQISSPSLSSLSVGPSCPVFTFTRDRQLPTEESLDFQQFKVESRIESLQRAMTNQTPSPHTIRRRIKDVESAWENLMLMSSFENSTARIGIEERKENVFLQAEKRLEEVRVNPMEKNDDPASSEVRFKGSDLLNISIEVFDHISEKRLPKT